MPYHLDHSLVIPRPRPEVFAFLADAGNLERITPDFLNFHIVTPQPIPMHAGAIIDYRLRLFGLPFYWRTLIEAFDPISSFVDLQLKGPYRLWRHHHVFTDAPGGTLMLDHVQYEMPFGSLGSITRRLVVRRALNRIFDHRNATILKILGR